MPLLSRDIYFAGISFHMVMDCGLQAANYT